MKIMICGGTGFIGKALTGFWVSQREEVIIVTRKIPDHTEEQQLVSYVTWDQLRSQPEQFEGIDAIVNLTGESINQRWTTSAKQRILESRLEAARRVADFVAALQQKPQVVINASGISIYGTSEQDCYDEESPHRLTDFLAEVVEEWEQAADQIRDTRIVKLRVGLVLGNKGGAYPKMRLPYMMGVGGKVGSGQQWFSWIHIIDMVRLIDFCIRNSQIEGPINATAPYPVRNNEFGQTLGKVYGRPHWFPVPSFLLKMLFGELSVLLLQGQKVLPQTALMNGFPYRYPKLEAALGALKSGKDE